MKLNFSNEHYFALACELAETPSAEWALTKEHALLLLIRGVRQAQLDNLLRAIRVFYPDLTEDDIYGMLQTDAGVIDEKSVYNCAVGCLLNNEKIGTEVSPNGGFNTSSWISHSLWEGRLCGILAGFMGLDAERAEVMGILHDFGRKEVHTLAHVTRGFEMLADLGFAREGIACISHSFLNGGRCSNNDPAEDGFYVSDEGYPSWRPDAEKDQIAVFLEKYSYTIYDRLLNLGDLMAASFGIISPYERILDIATRRTIDPVNRGYFLADLISQLNEFAKMMGFDCGGPEYEDLRFTKGRTIDEMNEILKKLSADFFRCYNERISGRGSDI